MTVTEQKIGQDVIAQIAGRFDGVTSLEIQRSLLNLLEKNMLLLVDFKNVSYISSAGMRTLLVVYKRAKEMSSQVCLIQLTPPIKEVLEMSGFLTLLPSYEDLETALKNQAK